jgi:hypothetical protein
MQVREYCKGQVALSVQSHTGKVLDCTGVQLAGMLDDLFATEEPLGDHTTADTKSRAVSVWVSLPDNVAVLFQAILSDTLGTGVVCSAEHGSWCMWCTPRVSFTEAHFVMAPTHTACCSKLLELACTVVSLLLALSCLCICMHVVFCHMSPPSVPRSRTFCICILAARMPAGLSLD